jgi:hypothetical protein
MISISKKERAYLENHGCVVGEDIHVTHSRFKHSFAVENGKVKSLLKQYESEIRSKN